MRRGLFVVGLVVLIVGLGLALLPFLATTTESVPAGSVLTISPNYLGSGTVTVSWSGAPSGTDVRLFSCTNAQCTPGNDIASGQGGSGSFSANLVGGTMYGIATSGTGGAAVALTLKAVGLTPLVLVGIVLLVIGAALAGLSFRRRREASAPVAGSAPAETAGAVEGEGAPGETVYSVPEPETHTAGSDRPPLTCQYCGTQNEVWITNCRKCKRPLHSTA